MTNYYVYSYTRDKDSAVGLAGTPYYIGKGKDNRAFKKHGKHPAPALDRIKFLATNLSEKDALQLEMNYIYIYGKVCDGTVSLETLVMVVINHL